MYFNQFIHSFYCKVRKVLVFFCIELVPGHSFCQERHADDMGDGLFYESFVVGLTRTVTNDKHTGLSAYQ